MSAYIAFIASLNLCIGYALGVYIGVLPGITPRRSEEDEHDEPIGLTTAAPLKVPVEVPQAEAVPPSPEVPKVPEVSQAAPVAQEPAEPPPAPPAEAAAMEVDDPFAEEPPAEHNYILDGLSDFKSKLDKVSSKLTAAVDDRESVDECAGEIKDANNDYLEVTSAAIESMNADETAEITVEEQKLRLLLNKQTEDVRRANDEIDELLDHKDSEVVRQKLVASTEQLSEAASTVEQAMPVVAKSTEESASPDPVETSTVPEDPEVDVAAAIESLMDLIDQAVAAEATDAPLQVATLDLQVGTGDTSEHAKLLLHGVEGIVAAELAPQQTMAVDAKGRLVLTLANDSADQAQKRCERIRQRVAQTTFRRNGQEQQVNMICSIADTQAAESRETVIVRLEYGLAEAQKLGESRTFRHDGTMAVPIAAVNVTFEPNVVEF